MTWGRKSLWPWIVVGLWLAGSALGFWFFQLRDRRPFETGTAREFDARARTESAEAWYRSAVAQAASPAAATVVHVYRPGCTCNRFTEPHLAKIVARYRGEGVHFIVATRERSTVRVHGLGDLSQVTIPDERKLDWLDSTPAALIYDAAGKLVYFGPYSSASWCGAPGGLVERVLDRVLAGQTPRLQPFYSTGCFCPRRTQVTHG